MDYFRGHHNLCVGGSSPSSATIFLIKINSLWILIEFQSFLQSTDQICLLSAKSGHSAMVIITLKAYQALPPSEHLSAAWQCVWVQTQFYFLVLCIRVGVRILCRALDGPIIPL